MSFFVNQDQELATALARSRETYEEDQEYGLALEEAIQNSLTERKHPEEQVPRHFKQCKVQQEELKCLWHALNTILCLYGGNYAQLARTEENFKALVLAGFNRCMEASHGLEDNEVFRIGNLEFNTLMIRYNSFQEQMNLARCGNWPYEGVPYGIVGAKLEKNAVFLSDLSGVKTHERFTLYEQFNAKKTTWDYKGLVGAILYSSIERHFWAMGFNTENDEWYNLDSKLTPDGVRRYDMEIVILSKRADMMWVFTPVPKLCCIQ